ncbi:hypothetical protein MMC13_007967 [Lambiella insularis]|nr:hypothetical protein [Lambiella insularis]
MFSSFTTFSVPFSIPRYFRARPSVQVAIKPVKVHDVETQHDTRARTLKHLLKLNHVNHSIFYHHLQFDNHMPHILGSAYLWGAQEDHLNKVYDKESKELEKWQDSPNEVSTYDWRDYLGDRRYQRAYVDFFEDELVLNGYNWPKVIDKYLFQGKEPLINCLVAGLGHPLIHLGYAYELSSRELAMEALGLSATSYSFLHKYLDNASYTKTLTYQIDSPLDILRRVAADDRFNGLFNSPGGNNMDILLSNHEDLLLEHWNAWQMVDAKKQFQDSQHAATALLVATHESKSNEYDFFLVHLLTTNHAVRVLLPVVPVQFHVSLIRQWWLLVLMVYVSQLRPCIVEDLVHQFDLAERDWAWVKKRAIEGQWAMDAHYVKALRAMMEAAKTWGDENKFYLKAAVKFADSFRGWGGFKPLDPARIV